MYRNSAKNFKYALPQIANKAAKKLFQTFPETQETISEQTIFICPQNKRN
jgi:hypothetical protein